MKKEFALLALVLFMCACGVKGDPVSIEEEAIISDGVQRTARDKNYKNLKQKQSPEEESNENKKKQSR